jgi:glutamyl-Q tRNA(Asp) synthetase
MPLDKGMHSRPYVGRFAPSPTGPLHAGSVVAALASWLDARAHGGRWLVRIEDVDAPRCAEHHADTILRQLDALGLQSDAEVVWQSRRSHFYQRALEQLQQAERVYPCSCSRREIEDFWLQRGGASARHQAAVYPGICRPPAQALPDRSHAWRLNVQPIVGPQSTAFVDRWMGGQVQRVAVEVGDFVLKRADGCWAYQLAVVVDDADQGVTHVVRGADLLDNTARQIVLQQALGISTPVYGHVALVLNSQGEKLSKQQGAQSISSQTPQQVWATLCQAADHLDLGIEEPEKSDAPASDQQRQQRLEIWVQRWKNRWL